MSLDLAVFETVVYIFNHSIASGPEMYAVLPVGGLAMIQPVIL